MRCKKCGAEVSDKAFVCTSCGEVLREIGVPSAEDEGSAVEDTAPLWFLADDSGAEPKSEETEPETQDSFLAAEEPESKSEDSFLAVEETEPEDSFLAVEETEPENSFLVEEETGAENTFLEAEPEDEVHFVPMQENRKKSRMELLLEKANNALKANVDANDDDDNYMFVTDNVAEEEVEEAVEEVAEEQYGSKMAQLAENSIKSEEEDSDTGFRSAILNKRREEAKLANEAFIVEDNDTYMSVAENESSSPVAASDTVVEASTGGDNAGNFIVGEEKKPEAPTRLSKKVEKKRRMTYKVFNKISPLSVIVSVFLSTLIFICITCLLICLSTQNSSLMENTKKAVEEMDLEAKYGDTAIGENINFEFLTNVISHSVTPVLIGLYIILIIYLVSLLLRVNIVNQKLTLLYLGIPCIVSGSILYEATANYDVFAKMVCRMLNANDYITELICKVLSDILADLALIAALVGIIMCILLAFSIIVEILKTPNRSANEQTIHRRVFGD